MIEYRHNNLGLKVLTDTGFSSFEGVSLMGTKPVIELIFADGSGITCTPDHKFFSITGEKIEAKDIAIGQEILSLCENGASTLAKIVHTNRTEPVYDLIDVEDNNRFYANQILASNCEFVIADETLIDSMKLGQLSGVEPIMKMGECRWFEKPTRDSIYVVSLDPSLGTGGDNAAIQVVELPSMVQIAEWQHNTTPIDGQIKMLKDICRYLSDITSTSRATNVYWSVENNTIGEAALIAIKNIGEENIPGLFLAEPIKKGHMRKFRKGFSTTHRTKISACSRLKYMIENDKLKINSRPLISELKTYVASGASFRAKRGSRDDLVAAMLLVMRMCAVLADWDPRIFDLMTGRGGLEEEYEPPMPIFISGK